MTDLFITELDAITTFNDPDLAVIETNPAGTPETNKITLANLLAQQLLRTGYRLSVTVASNNITVAIKDFNGSNFTANNPLTMNIDGALRKLSGALSVTANAGTNWFNSGGAELATKETDYFVYLGYNATDGVVIGFSRIPHACIYSDFNTTSTNDRYCKISTITSASSSDPYINIGRFAATLSAGAGYTWTVPTYTPLNLVQRPIYETRWLNWTPTLTGFSANPTDTSYRYKISRNKVDFAFSQVTNGTSNATTYTATLPITPVTATNTFWVMQGNGVDNNVLLATPIKMTISSGTLAANLYKDMANAAWTNTNGKRALASGWYEI